MCQPLQVLEVSLSEGDIEKEHQAQLKRWKEIRGELKHKTPPRMHGAWAIMAAEPPSQQDLQQTPTIIPPPQENKEVPELKDNKKKASLRKKKTPKEIPNPYALPSDPKPLLKGSPLQESNLSISSAEQDTYL